jgi:hypothetical protein
MGLLLGTERERNGFGSMDCGRDDRVERLTRGRGCCILLMFPAMEVFLDAVRGNDRSVWLIPAAVLGGCMLLGLVVGGCWEQRSRRLGFPTGM